MIDQQDSSALAPSAGEKQQQIKITAEDVANLDKLFAEPSAGEEQHKISAEDLESEDLFAAMAAEEEQPKITAEHQGELEDLFAAIVAALFEEFISGEHPEQSEQQTLIMGTPVSRAQFQRYFVDGWLEKLAKAAGKDRMAVLKRAGKAQTVATHFLHEYTFKLYDLDCQPDDVANYLKCAKRCLASLYLEATKPTPSPLQLRQLAVRFATDPRYPLPGNQGRFTASDCEIVNTDCWEIVDVTPPWESSIGLPAHMLVMDFYSTHVLRLAFNSPPSYSLLIEFIELILRKVPTAEDALLDLLTAEGKRAILEKMEPARWMAYLAYQYVQTKLGKILRDKDAYDWIKERGFEAGHGELGELDDYKLTTLETFQRYLSDARAALGERKYERRCGRPHRSSIIEAEQREYQNADES